jgi:hypothetical protein
MPIVATTAVASDHRVDRTERSFVHSDRMTRSCVTRPGGMGIRRVT